MTRRTRNGLATVSVFVTGAALLTGCGSASAQTLDATDSPRTADAVATNLAAPTVKLLAAKGEGCPDNRSVVLTQANSGYFIVRFTKLSARVGPKISSQESRRGCTLALTVTSPRGTRYAVKEVRVEGQAALAKGARGQIDITAAPQAGTTGKFKYALTGQRKGAYKKEGTIAPVVGSVCGDTRALIIGASVFTSRGSSSKSVTSTLNLMPAKTKGGLALRLIALNC
jgi:hypothetical protein